MTGSSMARVLSALSFSVLLVAGCATDSDPTEATGRNTSPAVTTTAEKPSTTSAMTSTAEVEVSSSQAVEPAAGHSVDSTGPTFVRCHLADGTALMSDGSHVYMDSCHESAGLPNFDSAAARAWSECVIANGQDWCANAFAPETANTPDTVPPARAPEVEAEKQAAHDWWSECIAVNTAESCRANDPWQQ